MIFEFLKQSFSNWLDPKLLELRHRRDLRELNPRMFLNPKDTGSKQHIFNLN